jgi:Tfp pilus assembly protein PilW
MIGAARERLGDDEAGLTLIELLVAAAMGVVLMGAVVTVLIGALRAQPKLSASAGNIQTARFALERMTRELRNGFSVAPGATSTSVSFETYVRHSSCGSNALLAATSPSIKCQVRYTCESGACKRTETQPGVLTGGTPVTILKGLTAASGFSYPSATYVKVTLVIPAAGGGTDTTTVSDGASLRNATLAY